MQIPQFESDDPCITAESFVLAHRLIKAFDKIEVDEQKYAVLSTFSSDHSIALNGRNVM